MRSLKIFADVTDVAKLWAEEESESYLYGTQITQMQPVDKVKNFGTEVLGDNIG